MLESNALRKKIKNKYRDPESSLPAKKKCEGMGEKKIFTPTYVVIVVKIPWKAYLDTIFVHGNKIKLHKNWLMDVTSDVD